jgi:hypothetical protein
MKIRVLFVGFFLIISFFILNFFEIPPIVLKSSNFDYKHFNFNLPITFAAGLLNTLDVQAFSSTTPLTGVFVSSTNPLYGSTTQYTISTTSGISGTLTAPLSYNNGSVNYIFNCWEGCDSVSGNRCFVSASNGVTQKVVAYYRAPDLAIEGLDIRTFICNNSNYDSSQSFWNSVSSTYPSYAPSTTWAYAYYTEVATSTCPESHVNRPVEFSVRIKCKDGPCPDGQVQFEISPDDSTGITASDQWYEATTTQFSFASSTTGNIENRSFIYSFNNYYDFKVTARLLNSSGAVLQDYDNSNNVVSSKVRIFNYFCNFGFAARRQIDKSVIGEPKWKVTTYASIDSPIRYWYNAICRESIGF